MALHKIAQDRVGPEWPRTDQVGPDPANVVEELSAPKLIALHLIPGALVTVAFVPFAPLVQAAGLPPIAALLVAILLVLVPVELGIVLRAVRRDGGAAAVAFRAAASRRRASNAEAVVAGQHVNEQIRPTSAGTRNDQRAVISAEVAFPCTSPSGRVLSRHQDLVYRGYGLRRPWLVVEGEAIMTIATGHGDLRQPGRAQPTAKSRIGSIVALSMAAGLIVAVALVAAPFIPASENVLIGVVLLGFALGWALLAVLSIRFSDQSQRWAAAPAAFMALVGLGSFSGSAAVQAGFSWVWPPVLFALVVWMIVQVRRQVLTRIGRWLLYPVLAVLAIAAWAAATRPCANRSRPRPTPRPAS